MRKILAVFLLFINIILVIINSSSKNVLNDLKKEKMKHIKKDKAQIVGMEEAESNLQLLSRPQRIAKLAERYLDTKAQSASQIIDIGGFK